jgi:hypothetical protein
MVYLYHYTDGQGAKKILESRVIRATKGIKGDGVYFTTMSPDNDDYVLIKNNWDDGKSVIKDYSQRIRYYFQFDSNDLKGVQDVSTQDRDIWIYKGPLQLGASGKPFHFGETEQDYATIVGYVIFG